MSIVNRRNAIVGWFVMKLGKRAARKKARDVNKPKLFGGLGALGALGGLIGGLAFWRKKRSSRD
ncbi:MAG: hypothetical protein WBB74_10445 [Gaiellaceae bacterium]